MSEKGYEITGGSTERLESLSNSPEFSGLVDEWVNDQFESPKLPPSVREQAIIDILNGVPFGPEMRDVLSQIRDKIRDIFPQFSRQRKADTLRKSDMKTYLKDTLEKAIREGDMFIARDERSQRIIGMAKVSKLENVGQNKWVQGEVVEIGKAFIVPDARGAGIYGQLRDQVLEHARIKYPDASLLTGTKSDAVKHMCRKAGWKEVPYGAYMKIHGASDEDISTYEPKMAAQGWCAFLYQPEAKTE